MNKFKKGLSLFLTVLIAVISLNALSLSASAEEGVTEIATYEDLCNIKNDLGGSYVLINDITVPNGEVFAPIGSSKEPFTGTLDGGGYSVKGLTVSQNGDKTAALGMFSYLNGTVKNIAIIGVSNTEVSDCTYLYAGTVAGVVLGSGNIKNCIVSGKLSIKNNNIAYSYIGGAVGRFGGRFLEQVVTDIDVNADNDGSVTAGGLCGEDVGGVIWRSVSSGDVTVRTDGNCIVGGIVGIVSNSGARLQDNNCSSLIETSYNETNESIFIGGIAAKTEGKDKPVVLINMFSGSIKYKEPGSMALENARFYRMGIIAASGDYDETSEDNFYVDGTVLKGRNDAAGIKTKGMTVSELRSYFGSRSDFWIFPEEEDALPTIAEYTVNYGFARPLDEENNAVNAELPVRLDITAKSGLTASVDTKIKLRNASTSGFTMTSYGYKKSVNGVEVYIPGDVNRDFAVTTSDVVALRNAVLLGTELTGGNLCSAEVDGNDGITVTDIVKVMDIALNK